MGLLPTKELYTQLPLYNTTHKGAYYLYTNPYTTSGNFTTPIVFVDTNPFEYGLFIAAPSGSGISTCVDYCLSSLEKICEWIDPSWSQPILQILTKNTPGLGTWFLSRLTD